MKNTDVPQPGSIFFHGDRRGYQVRTALKATAPESAC